MASVHLLCGQAGSRQDHPGLVLDLRERIALLGAPAVVDAGLEARSRELPAGTFEITRAMFELFSGWFEPRGEDRGRPRRGAARPERPSCDH